MSLLAMALIVTPTGLWRPQAAFPLAVVAVTASVIFSIGALAEVSQNDAPLRHLLGNWEPPLGIEYVVDYVSGFVAVVITSVALLVIMATRGTVTETGRERTGIYYGLVLLLLAGLTGIVVTGDLFNLFVFLEIASLAAYTLVFIGDQRAMVAGFRYLILGTIGGALYLLGVGFLYFATGTLNMADMAARMPEVAELRSVQAGAVPIFVGLGLKMALFPMHLWLPDAYTYSSSSVNSLIAPIMTKVAAYAMLRMFLSVFSPTYLQDEVPIADALIVLGLIGVIAGSVAAISQRDLRRMLAYSSVSQISLIAVAIGLASPLAFVAALLHVMNHAVMKATLFLAAASVRQSTGSSEIERMTGLGKRMPITMMAFSFGAISLVGIPPTAGFFSKWYLVQAGIDAGQWPVAVVVLVSSLLTAVYLFRILERVYLRSYPPEPDPAMGGRGGVTTQTVTAVREAPVSMLVPMLVLGLATVALGLMNSAIVTRVLERGV
jgi:multicomponent Na+:H+ antiporter subunit D